MSQILDFLLLLAQFAGGPGPKENNLMRFGLPAVLWLALLIVAWSRQRQQELPREKLLVWGFGLGLARELFMFSHVAMQLMGLALEESAGSFCRAVGARADAGGPRGGRGRVLALPFGRCFHLTPLPVDRVDGNGHLLSLYIVVVGSTHHS